MCMKKERVYTRTHACGFVVSSSCVHTGSMCGSRGGPAPGGETGAAVTTGANDVIAGSKQINTAAVVGATGPL